MPSAEVYICDKTADHGKGHACRKVVEAGVSIQLRALPRPFEDGHQITVDRAFCNAFHAQHWLRRIAVKELPFDVPAGVSCETCGGVGFEYARGGPDGDERKVGCPECHGGEVGPGINEIGEQVIVTSGEIPGRVFSVMTDTFGREMAAKAVDVCTLDHPHCWPHAEGETCAVPGCGHFQDDDTETTFGPIAPAYADDMHRQIYNVGDPKPKRKRAKA